jgi:hypothetical protein
MTSLELRKFDMSMINYDNVVVMIGKRGSGKSYLVKDLLYHKRDIQVGTVISPTEHVNKYFGDFVPNQFIHDEYTPKLIESVLKRQSMVMKKLHKGHDEIDPRAVLLLDDCLYDNSWVKDKNIRACFMNGRHYKLLFLLTSQYPLVGTPALRTNIDFVFICSENILANRKRLYENFAGMMPSFSSFCQLMDQCTNNYECLVINNITKSSKITDQIFWYKAENHGNFRMGADIFWENNKEESSEDEEEEEEKDILEAYRPRKAGPRLLIKKIF